MLLLAAALFAAASTSAQPVRDMPAINPNAGQPANCPATSRFETARRGKTPKAQKLGDLPDADLNTVSLDGFRNQRNVVLYFYPRDGTPGCTIEACAFRGIVEIARCLRVSRVELSPEAGGIVNAPPSPPCPSARRHPLWIPADEGEQPGLGVRVVLHRHPGSILAGRSDDVLHRLHPGQQQGAELRIEAVVLTDASPFELAVLSELSFEHRLGTAVPGTGSPAAFPRVVLTGDRADDVAEHFTAQLAPVRRVVSHPKCARFAKDHLRHRVGQSRCAQDGEHNARPIFLHLHGGMKHIPGASFQRLIDKSAQ